MADVVREKALAAVEKAISDVTTLPEEPQASTTDHGKLGAEAVIKYSEAAAVHIEQVGREFMEDAERLFRECKDLSREIRRAAELQAAAITAATDRARTAAQSLTEVRDAFRKHIVQEHEQNEAKRIAESEHNPAATKR